MKILFWVCLSLIAYAYIGYAIWLRLYVVFRRRPVRKKPITPSVSIILAARNEEANLPTKLENLRHMNYPKELLEIVVASDGSTDRTPDILLESVYPVIPVILKEPNGKAYALNQAVERANGDILVFLDARQTVDSNAISELAACFADPEVGAASGQLVLEAAPGVPSAKGLGIYWKIEKAVRRLESATGSVVGVTGAIYAIRRELYTQIPRGTLLDDVFIPMHIARQGRRVIFEPMAVARDRVFNEAGKEFSRKVRTLTGNYQLLQLAPWLLSPNNPLLFRFISHKLLRLMVPLLLILLFLASALGRGSVYQLALWLQIVFYVLALLGAVSPLAHRLKPISIASTFVMLNAAAAVAFYNFMSGRERVWL